MDRSVKPVAVAGGLLAIALAAGCGSSGGGSVSGPSAPSPTAAPSTAAPSTDASRQFQDSASGLSLTVPAGYVLATTPAEAAERFPKVLGSGSDVAKKVSDAKDRLGKDTVMIAFHAPIDGLSDNIGLLKSAGSAPADPIEIQSSAFQAQARTSLTKAGAKALEFRDTKVGGQPAEQVNYSIASASGSPVYGRQFYVVHGSDVFILTVTAATTDRAQKVADDTTSSWTFS